MRYQRFLRVTYVFHILPNMPGAGLCSFKLWRLAMSLGSSRLWASCSDANRVPDPLRCVGDAGGDAVEATEEMESERVSFLATGVSILVMVAVI